MILRRVSFVVRHFDFAQSGLKCGEFIELLRSPYFVNHAERSRGAQVHSVLRQAQHDSKHGERSRTKQAKRVEI